MNALLILSTLVLCGSGLLQDDLAGFEKVLRARQNSMKRNSYNLREAQDIPSVDVGYLGCYNDEHYRAIQDPTALFSDQMTIKMCYDYCSPRKSRYFGLQLAKWCFCGASTDAYDIYGTATGCNNPCAGDNNEMCGGFWQNSVYMMPHDYNGHIGCYQDLGDDRAIEDPEFYKSDQMTVKMCYDSCRSRGKSYYALQDASWCFCGDVDATYDKHGVGNHCEMLCSGDNSEICGGLLLSNVYKIHADVESLLA